MPFVQATWDCLRRIGQSRLTRFQLVTWMIAACLATNVAFAQSSGGAGGASAGVAVGGSAGAAIVAVAGASSALPTTVFSATPVPSHLVSPFDVHPVDAVRGGVVTVEVAGTPVPRSAKDIALWLDQLSIGHPESVAADGKSFTFVVPERGQPGGDPAAPPELVRAGHYTFQAALTTSASEPPQTFTFGELRVVPEKAPQLLLDAIFPTIVYPNRDKLIITGSGLNGNPHDYSLVVDGVELPLCEKELTKDCKLKVVADSDHQLEVTQESFRNALGSDYQGDHKLALRAGDAMSSHVIEIACSAYTVGSIQFIAVLLTLILAALIIGLVTYGSGVRKVGTRSIAYSFLIDTETDTYSLGKTQAYLWLFAALLGYLYLALSRSLVQGKLDIVDMPDNLLKVLGISLGTTVGSVAITRWRGPKASGGVYPSLGDLISIGGVASPERVGFLVFTLVSILVFILNVAQVDPMVLGDLPKVPDGLLALSGLSAAGYLGGKMVRGGGPVLDEVIVVDSPPVPAQAGAATGLVLMFTGRHLGLDASFEVDGESLASLLDPSVHRDRRPIVVTPEERDDDRFAKSLKLTLSTLPASWSKALADATPVHVERPITIANSDGQRATANVTLRSEPVLAAAGS